MLRSLDIFKSSRSLLKSDPRHIRLPRPYRAHDEGFLGMSPRIRNSTKDIPEDIPAGDLLGDSGVTKNDSDEITHAVILVL
jgi:hypothetical protein